MVPSERHSTYFVLYIITGRFDFTLQSEETARRMLCYVGTPTHRWIAASRVTLTEPWANFQVAHMRMQQSVLLDHFCLNDFDTETLRTKLFSMSPRAFEWFRTANGLAADRVSCVRTGLLASNWSDPSEMVDSKTNVVSLDAWKRRSA